MAWTYATPNSSSPIYGPTLGMGGITANSRLLLRKSRKAACALCKKWQQVDKGNYGVCTANNEPTRWDTSRQCFEIIRR